MFDTDKFIQYVQEYSAIWEKGCKEYSDRNIKEKSWFNIGGNMFDDWEEKTDLEKQEKVKEMKNKWRHIRDSFAKFVNQGASGDPAPSKKKKYVYADALSFLQQSIEKRRTSGNIVHEEDNDETEEMEEAATNSISNEIGSAASNNEISSTPSTSIKKNINLKKSNRARKSADCTSFQTQLLQKLDASQNAEEDSDRAFLLSLLPNLKRLNEEEKLDFRLHTLQFFRNLRDKNRQQPIQQLPTPFPLFNYSQPYQYFQSSYPNTSHQPPQNSLRPTHNSLHSAHSRCPTGQTTPLLSPTPSSSQLSPHSNESSVHSQLSEYLNLDI